MRCQLLSTRASFICKDTSWAPSVHVSTWSVRILQDCVRQSVGAQFMRWKILKGWSTTRLKRRRATWLANKVGARARDLDDDRQWWLTVWGLFLAETLRETDKFSCSRELTDMFFKEAKKVLEEYPDRSDWGTGRCESIENATDASMNWLITTTHTVETDSTHTHTHTFTRFLLLLFVSLVSRSFSHHHHHTLGSSKCQEHFLPSLTVWAQFSESV